jgi:PAS domain S-box-containing protein
VFQLIINETIKKNSRKAMINFIRKIFKKINDKLRNHYSAQDLLKAKFLFYAGILVLVSNIVQIVYYASIDYVPLYLIVVISTILIALYMFMVLKGLLRVVSHLMIISIYTILIVGFMYSGGIESYILPILLLIVTFSFYFTNIIFGCFLFGSTIFIYIMDIITNFTDAFRDFIVINMESLSWLRLSTFVVSTAVLISFILYTMRSEEKLLRKTKDNEHKYRMLFNKMLNGFTYQKIILDKDGEPVDAECIEVNEKFQRLTGFSKDELIGKKYSELYKDWDKDELERWFRICGEVALNTSEIVIEKYLGQYKKWFSLYIYSFEKGYFAVILEDITDRKTRVKLLRESLKEKEVLIKEIHHRVKNNLQIITSLLTLEYNSIKDEEALVKFKESKERVMTIALIHENLYKSANLAYINIHEYIRKLTDIIYKSYYMSKKDIKLNIDAQDITLNVNICVPLGLIINEVMTNSLKYAFPEDKGEIYINFRYDENENNYCISIKDNGVGIPKGVDLENPKTLGIELIKILASQLQGSIDIDTSVGTKYTIEFSER